MNYFSKKKCTILSVLSLILMALGAVLVLMSDRFIGITYDFLSNSVFHREFDINKWIDSIQSFFLILAFAVIVADTLLFVKLDPKNKIILLGGMLFIVSVMILYANFTATGKHVNSDLSSELLLGRECVTEHSLWPRTWYYSTEIRLINTQIFSAFAWLFTSSLPAVKTIQSFFTCIALFFAEWYLLNQLNLKSFWLKFFIASVSFFPYSTIAWHVGAGENYYVPHGIFAIIYVATFIKLTLRKETVKRPKIFLAFFFIWAFLSGLSSIRYIFNFVFPFMLAIIILEAFKKDDSPKITDFKGFWIQNKKVFYSIAGLIFSGIGYAANNMILQKIYYFSQWNSMNFNNIGDTTLLDIWKGIIEIFGFKQGIAALTPGGIINVLVYIAVIMFVVYSVLAMKKNLPESNRILIVFLAVALVFNTFIYIHIDYIARYFYPILVFVFPILAIILSNAEISNVKKWFFGVVWSILLVSSTFATIQNRVVVDDNTKYKGAVEFIKNSDYKFGYATFGFGTIFTYLTDGKIEMGNLYKDRTDGDDIYITPTYKFDTWLTPSWYYTSDFDNKPIILLVTQRQYELAKDLKIFSSGKQVFEDENFRIFEYPDHQAFKDGF